MTHTLIFGEAETGESTQGVCLSYFEELVSENRPRAWAILRAVTYHTAWRLGPAPDSRKIEGDFSGDAPAACASSLFVVEKAGEVVFVGNPFAPYCKNDATPTPNSFCPEQWVQ